MKKPVVLFCMLLAAALTIYAQPSDFPNCIVPRMGENHSDPRLQDLNRLIKNILEEWKIPGCAIVIVEKDKVLFAGGFGTNNFSHGQMTIVRI